MGAITESSTIQRPSDVAISRRFEACGWSGRRPRVLMVTPRPCWPPDGGAKIRNLYLARGLAESFDVWMVTFAGNSSHPRDAEPWLGPELAERITMVPEPHRYGAMNLIRGAFGRTPLPVLNYTSAAMASAIEELILRERIDIVQLEGIHLSGYLDVIRRSQRRPIVICDWHNIESEIQARYAATTSSPARRLYSRVTSRRMAAHEARAAGVFDGHVVVSDRDAARLASLDECSPVRVVDNGVDVARFTDAEIGRAHTEWSHTHGNGDRPETKAGDRNRIVFVGLMDYHANVEAVQWFARDVWPGVRRQNPDLRFTIVGRNPASSVQTLATIPGIEVTGTVPDVRPYYCVALASVVPLHVGGGSRLKILESMAAGVPVISTRLGAEGLEVRDGESILLAETPSEFLRAVSALASDSGLWSSLSHGGREIVARRYDWSMLSAKLVTFHRGLLVRQAAQSNS